MSVQGSWQDRVQQIRERAHEASKKAWRRAQTTAAQGLAVVRSEATQWRTNPRTAAQRWKPTRRSIVVFSGGILVGLIVALIVRSSPPSTPTPAASTNRMAALFQRPLVTEQCKDAKPETEVALESAPAASAATPSKKSLAKPKSAASAPTRKHPAVAAAKTTKPTTFAKTTATKPAAVAKTAPTTTTTKTSHPTTAKTPPTAVAKTTTSAKAPAPTTVAKRTLPATTTAKTTASTRTQSPTKAPVQAKTSRAKKKKDCGLDCI